MMLLKVRSWWSSYKTTVLWIAVAVLSAAALLNIPHKFHRAVWTPEGSADLRSRYGEVQAWFAGKPIYGELEAVGYPPASYPMLWLLLGWSSLPTAKFFWAVTVLAMLLWLSYLVVRESGAMAVGALCAIALSMNGRVYAGLAISTPIWRALARSAPWSPSNSHGAMIWLSLMCCALVKPNLRAMYWMHPAENGNLWRLLGVGYIALTLITSFFQQFILYALLAG